MYSKRNFVAPDGKNVRTISKEAYQTFYILTLDPRKGSRELTKSEVDYFTSFKGKDLTLTLIRSWLGNMTDNSDGKNTKITPHKYNFDYTFTLTPDMSDMVKEPTRTTLGRFIFNLMLIDRLGFQKILPYMNEVMSASNSKKIDKKVTAAMLNDEITVKDMIKYIDTRDWFGLSLYTTVCNSFTPKTIKVAKGVKPLKEKLFRDNKEALDNGDATVMDKISKELIQAELDEIKDDLGATLYTSGARGSVNNHLKNIFVTRGSVFNTGTGKFDMIKNSLNDGLEITSIPAHADTVVIGSYARGVGTQDAGYFTKELIAGNQSSILGPKDSDCGTKLYRLKKVTNQSSGDLIGRYIFENGKTVLLTKDNIGKYIGKSVKLRTPLGCIGLNGNQYCYCNKCFGDRFYNIGVDNVGLLTARVGSSFLQASLAKFHDATVKVRAVDIDDMLL
jgi:hypothetical protein